MRVDEVLEAVTGRSGRTALVLAGVCLGFGAGTTWAQRAPAQQEWTPGPEAERQDALGLELGLSASQQERIQAIRDAQRAEREALQERIAANRDALHALLESGTADAAAVGELVLQGRRLEEECRALRDAEQKAIREVLTPEQRKKLDGPRPRRRGTGRGPGGRPNDWPGGPGASGPRPPIGSPGPQQLPW